MKKNIVFILAIMTTVTIYTQSTPPRGTAGNATVKQKIETGLHNVGANIQSKAQNFWNSFVTKTQEASISLQQGAKNVTTKLNSTDIKSSLQTVSSKTSQSIKDFWNQLTGNKKTSTDIIRHEIDNLDDVFSPLQKENNDTSDLFSL